VGHYRSVTTPQHVPALTNLARVEEYRYVWGDDAAYARRNSLAAVALHFDEGVLLIEVNGEFDEADMTLGRVANLRHCEAADCRVEDVTASSQWAALVGANSSWRWSMLNQQGYTDGAQIELTSKERLDTTFQWIAQASALAAAVVTPVQRRT
jgi:hypothetical protein